MGKPLYKVNIRRSDEIAYLSGVYMGDGTRRGTCLRVKSADIDFLEFIISQVRLVLNPKPNVAIRKDEDWYQIEVGAYNLWPLLYSWKRWLREKPESFIRGLFDSDGGVSVAIYHNHSIKYYFRAEVYLVSTKQYLLKEVSRVLKNMDIDNYIMLHQKKGSIGVINGKRFKRRRNVYKLRIRKDEAIKNYASRIGFAIRRKQKRLNDIVEILSKYSAKYRGYEWVRRYSWKRKKRTEWIKRDNPLLGDVIQELEKLKAHR
jgi:intein-encoded DNA endonuclease-like protein